MKTDVEKLIEIGNKLSKIDLTGMSHVSHEAKNDILDARGKVSDAIRKLRKVEQDK